MLVVLMLCTLLRFERKSRKEQVSVLLQLFPKKEEKNSWFIAFVMIRNFQRAGKGEF